jgi:hypothetical protein
MPGELLPAMAAPVVSKTSKAKLSRGKPDLYLIVSSRHLVDVVPLTQYSPKKTRFTSRISFATQEL